MEAKILPLKARALCARLASLWWRDLLTLPVMRTHLLFFQGVGLCILACRGRLPCLLSAAYSRILSLLQVSVLGCPDPVVHEIAYQYGKNVGIAFQVGPLLFRNVARWHSGKGDSDTQGGRAADIACFHSLAHR